MGRKLTEGCKNSVIYLVSLKAINLLRKMTMFILNLSTDSGASASTSARSSRSSTLGSGLSTRSATSSESDSETEALDNVRVVAR